MLTLSTCFIILLTMTTRKQTDQFRHFNRFYTNYMGLLGNSLYDRPVNLTEARILYELDSQTAISARDLMKLLALDKGYVSRLIRKFVKSGWVIENRSRKDARVKMLTLTPKGNFLMNRLHEDACEQAHLVLDKIADKDKKQLLKAMKTIEKILSH